MKHYWLTGELSLFIVFNDEYTCLSNVSEARIEFKKDKAIVHLRSPLPEGFRLLKFPTDATIILQDAICGPRDFFNPEFNHIFIEWCEIKKRWLDNIELSPQGQDWVIANLIVEGGVKFYDKD